MKVTCHTCDMRLKEKFWVHRMKIGTQDPINGFNITFIVFDYLVNDSMATCWYLIKALLFLSNEQSIYRLHILS